MDTLDFAKMVASGHDMALDRDVFHREIEKRAASLGPQHGSPEQRYTKILETPEGKLLYKAYRAAPPKQAAQDLAPRIDRPEPAGPASRQMNALAQAMAKERKVSFEQGYARVLADPDHRDLVRRVRAEELAATRVVAEQRA